MTLTGDERILVVEDDPTTLGWLLAELAALPGVAASGCASVAEARRWLEAHSPNIVLTDLGLPDGSGIEVIGLALRLHPRCEVLVISIFGDDRHVVSAIEAGASGYLLKDSSLQLLGEQLQHLRDGGSPLSPQIARTLIRRQRPLTAPHGDACAPRLTERELEVLTFIAKGFSYQEGAAMLGVSTNTVRTHVKRIYQKLTVNSRSEAVYEYNLRQNARGLPPLR
jgi:DNA-binding NarL/FixJ family response regulator